MFIVSNPKLATVLQRIKGRGAIASIIGTKQTSFAILATIRIPQDITEITTTLPDYAGNIVEFEIENSELGIENIGSVYVVEIAGNSYTSATDPEDIQPGQFFWNFYTNTITVRFSS